MFQKIFLHFLLSFFLLAVVCLSKTTLASNKIITEPQSDYFRIYVITPQKSNYVIDRKKRTISIKTLNENFDNDLKQTSLLDQLPPKYIKSYNFKKGNLSEGIAHELELVLAHDSVEMFSFYKADQNQWIIDFWKTSDDNDEELAKDITPLKKDKLSSVQSSTKKVKTSQSAGKVVQSNQFVIPKLTSDSSIKQSEQKEHSSKVKDFRYGMTFVWDYLPAMSNLRPDIQLQSKTPDFLYPIEDIKDIKEEKDAQIQLIINMYRKEQYGLMTKAMTDFRSKYNDIYHNDLLNFIGINALLKSHIRKTNYSTQDSAIQQLLKLASSTQNKELKQASYRYVLQYFIDKKNYIEVIKTGKRLLAYAEENGENELINRSIQSIMYALAMLNQVEAIEKFKNEDIVQSWTNNQLSLSYLYYTYLKNGDETKLIKDFQNRESSLQKPIAPEIIFNVAESYFRLSEYRNAMKYFDIYVNRYSGESQSSKALLRLALCYDLLDKPYDQVVALYRRAIDRSSNLTSRVEAKLRLVGYSFNRLRKIEKSDLDKLAYLNLTRAEESTLDRQLTKSLWQIRLRSYLRLEDVKRANAYFQAIPLSKITLKDREVFLRDYSEIILGLLKEKYHQEKYGEVIRDWAVYKEKYKIYIENHPHILWYVANSYYKSGFHDKFYDYGMNIVTLLSEIQDFYPEWLTRGVIGANSSYFKIKRAVAQNNWDQVDTYIQQAKKNNDIDQTYQDYYLGLLSLHRKDMKGVVKHFEAIMVSNNFNNLSQVEKEVLLKEYLNAIQQVENNDAFQKKVQAVIASAGQAFPQIIERYYYLLAESFYTDKIKNLQSIQTVFETFNSRYTKSSYLPRLGYMLGVTLLKAGNLEDGKKMLKKLTEDDSTPSHIRDMAKGELFNMDVIEKL